MSRDEIIPIEDFEVRLVKSVRAKHILLKQNAKGEIILTCPRFCPKMMAIRFAKTQVPWIRAHILCGRQPGLGQKNKSGKYAAGGNFRGHSSISAFQFLIYISITAGSFPSEAARHLPQRIPNPRYATGLR